MGFKRFIPTLGAVALFALLWVGATSALAGVAAGMAPAAVRVQPSQPHPGGKHYGAARAALSAGDPDKAALEAKLALRDDPNDAAAHFLLGCLLARKGENDQALVAFQRTVAIDPVNPEALYNLGTMLLRRGEVLAASRTLENAVAIRPDHVPSHNNLAKAYFLAGLPELAVASYEESLRRDPSNELALRNLLQLAEGAGLRDTAAAYRRRLTALGSGTGAQPPTAGTEPLVLSPAWPVATRAHGGSSSATPTLPSRADQPRDSQAPPDREVEALRALLVDLPHVTVERRAGRLALTGWTSGSKERELLARILGKPSDPPGREAPGFDGKPSGVLDLTTEDVGDPQRMIEVDAVLFLVTGLDQTNVGFNFLKAIDMNFRYFASDTSGDGTGFLPGGAVGAVSGLATQGWFFGASADYVVNIANASEERVAVLARPHLTTLSQTPANFLAGGELVYKVSGNISGDIKPYPFGTSLTVTPTLLRTPAGDGTPRVHLRVTAGRTSVLTLLDEEDPDRPTNFTKVTVSGEAVLRIGQTMILSGLAQRESRSGRSGVPFLRDIPILKYLFSTRTTIVADAAVVILLTPRDAAFMDERNQKALTEFIEVRRAYLRALRGGAEDMRRFRERYPHADLIQPNRFSSHVFLMQNSEIYRAVSQQDLTSEDLNLELLGPRPEM